MGSHLIEAIGVNSVPFVLAPNGPGWIDADACWVGVRPLWCLNTLEGPLLHVGGGSLRKVQVECLANPAGWAFRAEGKLIVRENHSYIRT